MARVQLRLYVETTDENSDKERAFLQYIKDTFQEEYWGFEEETKERGYEVVVHQARLEHGW